MLMNESRFVNAPQLPSPRAIAEDEMLVGDWRDESVERALRGGSIDFGESRTMFLDIIFWFVC